MTKDYVSMRCKIPIIELLKTPLPTQGISSIFDNAQEQKAIWHLVPFSLDLFLFEHQIVYYFVVLSLRLEIANRINQNFRSLFQHESPEDMKRL